MLFHEEFSVLSNALYGKNVEIVVLAETVHVTPFGVDQLAAARFVMVGETVITDVAVDGAVAGAVRSGIGVEKLMNHSPISR